jgi:phosphoribosylformimino-5-aminoimidazole carboxamide ribotide isomerase
MLQIIPAIDIIDGKCVRLSQGDYAQKIIYNEKPLEVAKQFEGAGIRRLHLVDLDGAKQKKVVNFKVLDTIASKTNLVVDFGGGVQTDDDIRAVFDFGASQVTAGSIAVKNEELVEQWLADFGSEKIILGADAKAGKIAVSGWQETSDVWLTDFLEKYVEKGIRYTISTDVAKDGMLQGPNVEMYKDMKQQFPKLNIIASGGVSKFEDVEALAEIGIFGVIIGKAIYENRISLKQLEEFILSS